jgi:hypothetical protein
MKEQILLKQFEYAVPASSLTIAGINKNHAKGRHQPLLKVYIDFESGQLKLEGDGQFIKASKIHNEAKGPGRWLERVKIRMDIYPACAINLNDTESEGLVFPLEGKINDGHSSSSCTGLLVVDKIIGGQWTISIYLYDARFDDCEIKFKFPLYQTFINEKTN